MEIDKIAQVADENMNVDQAEAKGDNIVDDEMKDVEKTQSISTVEPETKEENEANDAGETNEDGTVNPDAGDAKANVDSNDKAANKTDNGNRRRSLRARPAVAVTPKASSSKAQQKRKSTTTTPKAAPPKKEPVKRKSANTTESAPRSKRAKREDRSDEYQVEEIREKRIQDGKVEYYVKWENYAEEQNTWEPEDSFFNRKMIDDFEKAQAEKRARERARQLMDTGVRIDLSVHENNGNGGNSNEAGPVVPARSVLGIDSVKDADGNLSLMAVMMEGAEQQQVPTAFLIETNPKLLIRFYERRILEGFESKEIMIADEADRLLAAQETGNGEEQSANEDMAQPEDEQNAAAEVVEKPMDG